MKRNIFLLILFSFSVPTHATEGTNSKVSKYAGQEKRDIKSLSPSDIKELRRGGGWGLAKSAELNGVPGPSHVLELKDQLSLTEDQGVAIGKIYNKMKEQAIKQGERLISHEQDLETLFRSGPVSSQALRSSLSKIEKARMELRYTHLATHLKMPEILSEDQIRTYNQLRGYSDPDPCSNPPKGHNAEMWRKHNGCN